MDIEALLRKITRVTKISGIVSGRSVKTDKGEVFIAFQADCLSPDSSISNGEAPFRGEASFSVKEARVAAYLLAMQTDIAAHEHALASGLIGQQFCQDSIQSIKTRYSVLLSNETKG